MENAKGTGTRVLVKCLVCGEIFDSSLEICPVCGVGKENFVPVEAQAAAYRRDSNEFYVILGNGAAGLNAAKAIRERDKTGSVVMISNEKYRTYNRPMLTKAIREDLNEEQIAVEPGKWYQENRIYQILDKEAETVDLKEKEVLLSGGLRMKYTKLIYALGAESFVPPISGREKAGVSAIRRLEDTVRIARMLPDIKHAVVIGGGVLGLEAAWELKKAGCTVVVLEAAPVLMGRQLDEAAGQMLKNIAEDAGIAIQTGVTIEEIMGEEAVSGVRLTDGTMFAADLVIISCGVRANISLAEAMGIATDRAVIVNSKMETNLPGVYACGDCAQYEGMNYAVWPQAVEQGKIAGANAAGDRQEYAQRSAALSFNGMNTALYALGDNGSDPKLSYETEEMVDEENRKYRKLYFLEGRLCGGILIGDVSGMAELTERMKG